MSGYGPACRLGRFTTVVEFPAGPGETPNFGTCRGAMTAGSFWFPRPSIFTPPASVPFIPQFDRRDSAQIWKTGEAARVGLTIDRAKEPERLKGVVRDKQVVCGRITGCVRLAEDI